MSSSPAGAPSGSDPSRSEPGEQGEGGDARPGGPGSGSAAEPADDLVTTQHTLVTRQQTLHYTATAGRLVLREESLTEETFQGHVPKAEVFLTAYTLDGADPGHRPVTFAFNGGPGSSSVWLHLGLLGPRRALCPDAGGPDAKGPDAGGPDAGAPDADRPDAAGPDAGGAPTPASFGLVDNPDSLLEHSDLVFIDPVSTGYSRASAGTKPKDYHGFTADVSSVAEIIRLWVTRNQRWLSPKFLAGESYGTVRAAALAEHLQSTYGMYPAGLMLLSSVLDFGTQFFTEGNDLAYALYVPTYAAVAHYHGLHGQRALPELLAEAEDFASGEYLLALERGSRLPAERRAAVAAKLAALSGLSEDFVARANLRVEHLRFCTQILRHRRLVTGRLDARFVGPERDYALERMSTDPSFTAIHGAFAAALNHYVRAELDYHNDLPYEILSFGVNSAWSFTEFQNAHVTVTDKLSAAMRADPALRAHVSFGYHDGATPYYAAEHALAHLAVPETSLANITRAYYHAGHMMYIHEESRRQQSADLARFVRTATPAAPSAG